MSANPAEVIIILGNRRAFSHPFVSPHTEEIQHDQLERKQLIKQAQYLLQSTRVLCKHNYVWLYLYSIEWLDRSGGNVDLVTVIIMVALKLLDTSPCKCVSCEKLPLR